jgi:hypothetical protein
VLRPRELVNRVLLAPNSGSFYMHGPRSANQRTTRYGKCHFSGTVHCDATIEEEEEDDDDLDEEIELHLKKYSRLKA